MVNINVKKKENAILPTYETEGAAGADIYACLGDQCEVITGGQKKMIPTGLYFEIPKGYEVQIRPRSGLAAKEGLTVLNAPGTIDSDYRGEVKVILYNTSTRNIQINHGDRIAQMVIAPVIQAGFTEVSALTETSRGEGGFGSTGKN